VAAATVCAVLLAAVLALAACGSAPEADSTSSGQTAIAIVDDTGTALTLDRPAKRVVSLAPSQTEMVFAAGGGRRLVGVSDYCDYPEDAKAIEKIGDFSDPNVEKIVALKPDLVVAAAGIQAEVAERLAEVGVTVAVLDPTTLDALFADLGELGALLGTEQQASDLVARLKRQVAEVEKQVAGQPVSSVFFEIYSKPLMTAGAGTLIEDIVRHAGGSNMGSAAGEGFLEFSEEVLLENDPDVYIAVEGAQSEPGDIEQRPGYEHLAAVKNDRVFVIDDDLVVRSGPRAVEGLQKIAVLLHPEAFAEGE
jgi:iron complex transport system substrate-binding protein